jgi:hypothetical protein
MATDQLETDLRELLAGQAGGVSTERLSKITTRNYHPRTHSTLAPLALGAGVAAVAAVASVAATSSSSTHRTVPSANSPVIHVTSAAPNHSVSAPTAGHTTLTLDGYRVSLPAKAATSAPGDYYWYIWAPDCSGGKATNTDCPAVAVVSLGAVLDNATKHEATAPDGTKVTWYVSTAGGNTITYFPVALPNGTTKNIGLQLANNGTMNDSDAIAFAQGINVVS